MQIIVVYFLYHVCPKKAIAQVVLKIKSAFYTQMQHFIGNIAAKLEDNALGNITFSFI